MAQDRDTQPHWYVAHTYSGYENKVRQDLETIVENRRLQDLIQEVRVPTETVVDADGKEKESKLFPGYVLVKMIMTDETWYVVRNARGVTGFVGPSTKPILSRRRKWKSLAWKRRCAAPRWPTRWATTCKSRAARWRASSALSRLSMKSRKRSM